ncbi:hypothetical protein [Azospirillum endophyticum]
MVALQTENSSFTTAARPNCIVETFRRHPFRITCTPCDSSDMPFRKSLPLRVAAVLPALTAFAAGPAVAASNVSAAQAEAKEIAKSMGNCTPAKVEVLRYTVGREGSTTFKVGCTEDKDAFVVVQCRSRICTLLR